MGDSRKRRASPQSVVQIWCLGLTVAHLFASNKNTHCHLWLTQNYFCCEIFGRIHPFTDGRGCLLISHLTTHTHPNKTLSMPCLHGVNMRRQYSHQIYLSHTTEYNHYQKTLSSIRFLGEDKKLHGASSS